MIETVALVLADPSLATEALAGAGERLSTGSEALSPESIAAKETGVEPGGFAIGGDYTSILEAMGVDPQQLESLADASRSRVETTGTLERGNINGNIAGGVPPLHAGHHLISVGIAKHYEFMKVLSDEFGYDINRGSNGIALPTTPELSVERELPLHQGSHITEYNELVQDKLDTVQHKYDNSLIEKADLPVEVAKVEHGLRHALLNDEVRLQHNDPRP
jgi:hypothetical protein